MPPPKAPGVPRLQDVANAAGVHLSTVSRALNPETRDRLSPAVAGRIQAAASELGYLGNAFAAGLRNGKSRTVGIVMRDLTDPKMPVMFRGIEERLREEGYVTLLCNTDADSGRRDELITDLINRRVDGIIAVHAEIGDAGGTLIRRHDVPFVLLNRSGGAVDAVSVLPDVVGGFRSAIAHLAELGHSAIAHIGGPESGDVSEIKTRAFIAMMRESMLHCSQDRIVRARHWSKEAGREATRALLQSAECPTAIVAADDILALGCLEELSRLRIACPRDISVVGFNDMPFVELIPPGLTTVRIPLREMGRAAAAALLSLIRGAPANPRALPTRLVVRASTASAPARGKNWAVREEDDPYGR